jgi:hypothetical protein
MEQLCGRESVVFVPLKETRKALLARHELHARQTLNFARITVVL